MEKHSTTAFKAYRMVLICWSCLLLLVGCKDSSMTNSENQSLPEPADSREERRIVHLYFSDKENSFLIAENRHVMNQNDPLALGSQIIQALLKGPQKALERTIPEHTTLNAFYLAQNGVAFVDLSSDVKENHSGGAKAELLTIYSIVNSLILNIHQIEAVKLLIDGHEASTLAGHIDLRMPLKANMLLIR